MALRGLLDSYTEEQRQRKLQTVTANKAKQEKAIICAACNAIITAPEEGISLSGSHDYWFTNPAGFRFHVGCFARAPGCCGLGESTHENSWFTGYAWVVAVCSKCGLHLGWKFSGRSDRFYGLILNRLVFS